MRTERRRQIAGYGPDGRPITRVSKLTTALVTALCVVVAGVAVKFAPVLTEADVRRGEVGESLQFYKSKLTVTDIRAGTEITSGYSYTDGEAIASKGLLLAITVRLDAPDEKQRVSASKLHAAGDRAYTSIDFASMTVPAGYSGTATFVYEVNPRYVDDLYLEVGDGAIFYAYPQELHIRLGISGDNAAQWQSSGAGQTVQASSTPELKALT